MHIVNFDEPAKPDALTIVDMSKGPQNASVRSPKVTIELIKIKGQARAKQLSCSPGRVASVSKQKLFQLRHERELYETLQMDTAVPLRVLPNQTPKNDATASNRLELSKQFRDPMATINQSDFIQSVADALQYISYYHPEDFITNLTRAYELEQSPAAKDAMAQILINSRMCAEGHRPICQDTGIVTAFVKVGMETRWDNGSQPLLTIQQMVDAGVRRAYLDPDNKLRGSILADPAFSRKNTGDNTPSVVSVEMVPGGEVDITVAAKGGEIGRAHV